MVETPEFSVADEHVVRFVAIGDAGRKNSLQREVGEAAVRHCAQRGCDFVLLLGDLVYPRGMEHPNDTEAVLRIVAPYADTGIPIVGVLGNHDYGHGSDRKRAGYLLDWAAERHDVVMPGNAWHTIAGPIKLVGLDTAAAMAFGAEPQKTWLKGVFSGIDGDPWVVVVGHHPRWSNGPHGNAGAYEGVRGLPWVSGNGVLSLLERVEERAHLYLSGHDHSRQLIDHGRMIQVVSGAGGSATRLVDRGNDPVFASATPGFVWIELRDDEGTLEFVDAAGAVDSAHIVRRRPR